MPPAYKPGAISPTSPPGTLMPLPTNVKNGLSPELSTQLKLT